jgi:exopolysaccharide production protein ExoQ
MTSPSQVASYGRPKGSWTLRLVDVHVWAFAALLVLIFVGFSPLKSGVNDWQASDGDGNGLKQAAFLFICGGVLATYVYKRGFAALKLMPLSVLVILVWCLLSAIWSAAPEISLRRSVLLFLVTSSVFACVSSIGGRGALEILYKFLAILILIDIVSVGLFPAASQTYQGGVAWAGIHGHKNTAGSIAALAVLLFTYRAIEHRSPVSIIMVLLGMVFLIGTRSTTSIYLAISLVFALLIYRAAQDRPRRRQIFRWAAACTLLGVLIAGLIWYEPIVSILEDPQTLTGRIRIWEVVMAYAAQNPLLGSGFGAFWEGPRAPARQFIQIPWLLGIGHAHNAYLEALASTGIIGLSLVVLGLAVLPLRRLVKNMGKNNVYALCFAWILFGVIGSLTKSVFLDRDAPEWFILAFALSLIYIKDNSVGVVVVSKDV